MFAHLAKLMLTHNGPTHQHKFGIWQIAVHPIKFCPWKGLLELLNLYIDIHQGR